MPGCPRAVGSIALPASWSRPVVDSVVLPAHAQTTFGAGFFGSEILQITDRGTNPAGSTRSVLDFLVGEAQAGGPLFPGPNSSEAFIEAFLSGESHLILAYTFIGTQEYAAYLEELTPPPECEAAVEDLISLTESSNRLACFSGQINAETLSELEITENCISALPEDATGPQAIIVSSSADAVEIRIENGPEDGSFFMTLVPGGAAPDFSCIDFLELIEDVEDCGINTTSTTDVSTFGGHA